MLLASGEPCASLQAKPGVVLPDTAPAVQRGPCVLPLHRPFCQLQRFLRWPDVMTPVLPVSPLHTSKSRPRLRASIFHRKSERPLIPGKSRNQRPARHSMENRGYGISIIAARQSCRHMPELSTHTEFCVRIDNLEKWQGYTAGT